ncbi:MAG: hypothetical protein IT481_06285 [Gammaproteobacteria bacterium]|jgi:uncharacterized lipoprotein|nr:hypothetical protein [Gammaproteobacteria bacterium]
MSKRASILLLSVAMLLLGGCGSLFKSSCAKPEDYAGAVDNKPLQIPAGLQGPDTRSALPVPPLNEPERPRAADESCLDAPPRYAVPAPVKPAA